MKQKSLFSAAMVAVLALSFGTASADDDGDSDKEKTRGEKRLERILEKYEPTGETRHCVPLRYLRDSQIIDDQTIFFHGLGKKAYMNKLPHRCISLAREERFMYSTSISQLCKSEIITVLDSFGRQWGSCGLGEFEEWQKKPKDDKQDDDKDN